VAADAPARRTVDLRPVAAAIAVPLLAIGLAAVLGAAAVVVAGEDPLTAYLELARAAMGTPENLAATVLRSIPVVVAGAGIALALRAGALNLGGEGQMIMGALASAAVANTFVGLPAPFAPVVAILAGCLAGAAWVLLPAILDVRIGVPMLITTLLMNYVGALLASWAVTHPLRDPAGGGLAQTATIPEAARLPVVVPGTRLHLGVIAIIVLPFVLRWILSRTVAGYEWRMVGLNRLFADYGGIDAGRRVLHATLWSGAICGLAGALIVIGVNHRFVDAVITNAGYAWSGFTAAILTGADPVSTLVAGVFLGGLEVGAAGMARTTQVPLQLVDVIQATIILVVAIRLGIRGRVRRTLDLE
jgi:general nucleoside transport system permease protein